VNTGDQHNKSQRRHHELWSLREDVGVELGHVGGSVRLHSRWGSVTVRRPSPAVVATLNRMRLGPISLENVIGGAQGDTVADGGSGGSGSGADSGDAADDARAGYLYRLLDRLQPLVVRSMATETGQPFLSVVPLTPQSRFHPVPLAPDVPVRLSTFAELRTDGTEYRLESPLSLHRVLLHQPEAVWLIGLLGCASTPAACAAALPFGDSVTADALAYLTAADMVVHAAVPPPAQARRQPIFAEDHDPFLAGWPPIDLMFHTRSTLGRHDNDIGATYPLGECRSPEPVTKPAAAGPGIPLYRPRWDDLLAGDPPLSVAIEGRRSVRSYSAEPPTAAELGELLYRTARVRSLTRSSLPEPSEAKAAGADTAVADGFAESSNRPYPCGGACYGLELYLTVGQCAGIPRGAYHYDALGHRLEMVNPDGSTVDKLLCHAAAAANTTTTPPILITMTSRIRRLSWKYEGLAYSLVLKHVGVLTQLLYLVSTAMRLSPCALGSLSIDMAARAFGTDWRIEPSVGAFLIGREPPTCSERLGGWQEANDASWASRARENLCGSGPKSRP